MNSLRQLLFFSNKSFAVTYKFPASKAYFPTLLKMTSPFSTEALKVEHDQSKSRFVIKLGKEKAFLLYKENPPGTFDLVHTWVPPTLQGKGIAKLLAKEAFDFVVKNNKKMILTCTYLKNYERENPSPEYKNHIVSK